MLRHLVCLLSGVLYAAVTSEELERALGPDGWTNLLRFYNDVRLLCQSRGW